MYDPGVNCEGCDAWGAWKLCLLGIYHTHLCQDCRLEFDCNEITRQLGSDRLRNVSQLERAIRQGAVHEVTLRCDQSTLLHDKIFEHITTTRKRWKKLKLPVEEDIITADTE